MTETPTRASGLSAADEAARDETKALDATLDFDTRDTNGALAGGPATRPEDKGMGLTPAFARMRTDWNGPDRDTITQVHRVVDQMIQSRFADAFDVFYRLFELVREQDFDPVTGEVRTDEWGVANWRRNADGFYVEDWSRIGVREREAFLYRLTTGLFAWQQAAADLHGDALMARALFEEAFAHGFEEIPNERATIDDRTARARIRAAEHRYHAVYRSYLSRKADAVVRSAESLSQRLKDIHLA